MSNIDIDNNYFLKTLNHTLLIINHKLVIHYNNKVNKIFDSDEKKLNKIISKHNILLIKNHIKSLNKSPSSKLKKSINFFLKQRTNNDYIYLDCSLGLYSTTTYSIILKDISDTYKQSIIQRCCYTISEAIYQSDDLDTLYKEIHMAVSEITNTNNFYIATINLADEIIEFPYFIDRVDEKPEPRGFKNGLTEYIINSGKSLLLDEKSYDSFIHENKINVVGQKCFNWIGIPLKLNNNKTIGMIGIQSYNDKNKFNENDLKLLELISNQIATAIKRKKDDIHIHKQAHYDALTGLTNKALFYDRLDHAILQAERQDEVIAVLFIDIDDFKYINDSLGHSAGDEVLKMVADIIKSSVRKSDTVSRWGGDEFCVLLPSVKSNEGVLKLYKRILNESFNNIKLKNKKIQLKVSIGISMYPMDGDKPEVLIDNADNAMYESKKNGKNQYRIFSSK